MKRRQEPPARAWSRACRGPARCLIVALLLLAGLLAAPVGASADDQIEQETREIARLLNCPVCQNLTVADSPSDLAGQMRDLIRRQLAAGQSREQVIAYFVDRYGDEVLLDPPKAGFSQLVWWGGAGLPLAGAALVALFIRGRLGRHADGEPPLAEPSDPEQRRYEGLLERELERAGGGERW